MASRCEVAVVGSINLDISVAVPHLPVPGETVLGGDALWSAGGKGANQAVAVARLGRRTAIVGCVGDDPAGEQQRAGLLANSVDCAGLVTLPDVPTGLATIAVAEDGENSIVVSSGANSRLTPEMVRSNLPAAEVLLLQFEVPADAVAAAIDAHHGLTVVNPAPARQLATDIWAGVDVVVPNQTELAFLSGNHPAATRDEVVDQARQLGAGLVIVTLGSDGALVVGGSAVTDVPVVEVSAVDTTAAGDAFCGGLVDALLTDPDDLVGATRWAARVAAVTVTRRGAQRSLPTRAEVEN